MVAVRKFIWGFLRTCIGLSLAAFLVYLTLRTTETNLLYELRHANVLMLAAAVLVFGIILLVLATTRWYILLRVQGIRLRYRDVARLTMIGHFFNLAVPGAVGGDLVKMGFITRQTPGKRTEAIFSIIVDRIMGLFGLFVVASVSVLCALPYLFRLEAEYRALKVAAFTIGLGSILGLLMVLAVEYHGTLLKLPGIRHVLDFLQVRLPGRITETAGRLVAALDLYRRCRKGVLSALLVSVAIHSTLALNLYLIGASVHEERLGVGKYFLTAQVANAVAAIPVTPAGVGTRDFVTKTFFESQGMVPAKIGAIPVILTLIIIFWGLCGALVFIVTPVPHGRSGTPGTYVPRR